MVVKSTGAEAPQHPVGREREDPRRDGVLDPAEIVMERMPARPERPPDPGKHEAPGRVSDQREDVVAAKRRFEHTCRDRDERPRDGRDSPDEHRPRVPAAKPRLGTVELSRSEVHPAAVTSNQTTAPADPDPPAEIC